MARRPSTKPKLPAGPWPIPGEWPISTVRMVATADITPNPNNPKRHPDSQIAAIAASITTFGWGRSSLLVDDKLMLLAGEGAWMAAQKLGLEQVPAAVVVGWSEEMKRAYMEADNRLPELGAWDDAARRRNMEFLQDRKFDFQAIGWSEGDRADFMNAWVSNINVERHGSNTDGINSRIVVTVAMADGDRAREVITKALADASITAQL